MGRPRSTIPWGQAVDLARWTRLRAERGAGAPSTAGHSARSGTTTQVMQLRRAVQHARSRSIRITRDSDGAESAVRPGSARGLRQGRAGDLGVDPQVVQRACQDRDDNRRPPCAVRRLRAEVASLTRRQRADCQPNHDHHCENLHALQSTPREQKRTPQPDPPTAPPTRRVGAPGARQRLDAASVVAGAGVWGSAVHAAASSTIRAMRLIQTSRVTRTANEASSAFLPALPATTLVPSTRTAPMPTAAITAPRRRSRPGGCASARTTTISAKVAASTTNATAIPRIRTNKPELSLRPASPSSQPAAAVTAMLSIVETNTARAIPANPASSRSLPVTAFPPAPRSSNIARTAVLSAAMQAVALSRSTTTAIAPATLRVALRTRSAGLSRPFPSPVSINPGMEVETVASTSWRRTPLLPSTAMNTV